MQAQLALLNRLSASQQQLVFAGTAATDFPTLEAWKAQFGQNQSQMEADHSQDQKSGSSSAAGESLSGAPAGDAEQALKVLTAPKTTESAADVALALLQNAAKATKAAKDQDPGGAASSARAAISNAPGAAGRQAGYKVGGAVDITA